MKGGVKELPKLQQRFCRFIRKETALVLMALHFSSSFVHQLCRNKHTSIRDTRVNNNE